MWTYWTSFLSCCLKHMQTRYGSPRVDSRCHQEHGWDSPCNCRIPSPQFILPSELICAFRGPEHAEVVPTFPSLSSWPFPKNILRPGLCSRDCLGYQLSQTIWCFISSHIGWRLLSQISWLHDFSMCGRRDWAVMLSTTSGMLCLLGFILQFFWGKKNLIISFLFHWVQWWVLVGGGDAGKKKKKKGLFFQIIICLWNPVMKTYVGGKKDFGRRTHSKTYWPKQWASHMLYTNDLYEYKQYSWGEGRPLLAMAKSSWKNKENRNDTIGVRKEELDNKSITKWGFKKKKAWAKNSRRQFSALQGLFFSISLIISLLLLKGKIFFFTALIPSKYFSASDILGNYWFRSLSLNVGTYNT